MYLLIDVCTQINEDRHTLLMAALTRLVQSRYPLLEFVGGRISLLVNESSDAIAVTSAGGHKKLIDSKC